MNSDERPTYNFITYSNGTTSAKTPEEMFKERAVANDVMMVCNRSKEYFKLT
jgi:hypothetical protein